MVVIQALCLAQISQWATAMLWMFWYLLPISLPLQGWLDYEFSRDVGTILLLLCFLREVYLLFSQVGCLSVPCDPFSLQYNFDFFLFDTWASTKGRHQKSVVLHPNSLLWQVLYGMFCSNFTAWFLDEYKEKENCLSFRVQKMGTTRIFNNFVCTYLAVLLCIFW